MVPRTQRTASGVGVARSGHLESTHGVDARCRRETSTQEVDRDIEGMPRGRPGCERWMRSRGWPADQVRERPSWRRESVVARGRGGDADDRRRASDPARSRVTSARRCAARVRRSITASPHSTPRAQSAAPTRALVPLSGAAVRTCSWAAAAAWSNASTTAAVRRGSAVLVLRSVGGHGEGEEQQERQARRGNEPHYHRRGDGARGSEDPGRAAHSPDPTRIGYRVPSRARRCRRLALDAVPRLVVKPRTT